MNVRYGGVHSDQILGLNKMARAIVLPGQFLFLKKFNNEVFWAIPLSTKMKKSRFYVALSATDGIERVAIISQLRLVDAKRLLDKIAVVSESEYREIQKAVISLCDS